MLTCDQLQSQVSASKAPTGIINSSRCINKEDEVHLRDYTLAASVISWDSGTFGTSFQVTAGDITNIAITGDTVWYQLNLHRAIPLDIETFHAHRLRIEAHKAQLEVAEERQQGQPGGEAGDTVSCELQPTPLSPTEYEIGRQHGQADAAERLHPIYTKPSCEYASGYLEGYHSNSTEQPKEEAGEQGALSGGEGLSPMPSAPCPEASSPSQQVEWSVTYDPKWQWYQAWVKDRCIGHGSTPEQAERIAQKYIALGEMIRRQNAAVMKAYGG